MNRNRLVTGFLTLVVGALISSTAAVGAMSSAHNLVNNPPASKADCQNGAWKTHTDENGVPFSSQAQCLAWLTQRGYNGGTDINISVNTSVSGNNNIVTNIVNFFFGSTSTPANVTLGLNTAVQGNNNVVTNLVNMIFASGTQPPNVNVAANTDVHGNNNVITNVMRFIFA